MSKTDVMNRPWCTPLPALTGNWIRIGKSRMEDVISAPSSGYLSDGKDFIDCAEAPLNEVLLFKLANGKYAKLMIISDEQSKTSSGCEHKITYYEITTLIFCCSYIFICHHWL